MDVFFSSVEKRGTENDAEVYLFGVRLQNLLKFSSFLSLHLTTLFLFFSSVGICFFLMNLLYKGFE